jgi:hypothetical protein
MYTEEYKNTGDLYKAKTFRTIHIPFKTPTLIVYMCIISATCLISSVINQNEILKINNNIAQIRKIYNI